MSGTDDKPSQTRGFFVGCRNKMEAIVGERTLVPVTC